jgi:NTE family protein
VEIDGEWFWDGGYMGNPPLFPAFNNSPSDDIVIVQINPVLREGPPKRAQDILNRVNEITFNSALIHELRSVEMVNGLLRTGRLRGGRRYREKFIHVIEARKRMRPLDASSKLNAEWAFLRHLFEIGREAAERWIEAHYDCLGARSSVDLRELVSGERVSREHARKAAE